MSVAFVDLTTGAIHSVHTSSQDPMNRFLIKEPATPIGCINVSIPLSIVCMDAIKAVSISDYPGFEIVDDEDKLAIIRIQNLPYIRETRTQLLTICDWRVMPDAVLTPEQRSKWVAYRQALRDFPETNGVINQVWPTMP